MLLRRVSENLKSQNWPAVGLDFLVVVIGIFLAFQLERWYSDQRLRSSVEERLIALSEDFESNHDVLVRSIDMRKVALEAAFTLLELDQLEVSELDSDSFYRALAEVSRTLRPRIRRGAYDVLIATGEIEFIEDQSLKTELAEYFVILDELLVFNEGVWTLDRITFEPYVSRNLDHVAMLHKLHPDRFDKAMPTHDSRQFIEVLGTTEFEGVVAAKSHATTDEIARLQRLLDRNSKIRERLEESLHVQ